MYSDISKMNHEDLERRDKGKDGTQARELVLKFIKKKWCVGVGREIGKRVISRTLFCPRSTWNLINLSSSVISLLS